MATSPAQKLAAALGARITASRALPGGDIADVSLLTLDNHTEVVAKRPRMDQPDTTAVEAMMLKHLAKVSDLPVPKVLFQQKNMLVISYVPHKGVTNGQQAARDIAEHVAKLHDVTATAKKPYGFEKDTFIGPLPQVNTAAQNWVDFYRDNRLAKMVTSCQNVGRIDSVLVQRLERLAAKLGDFLPVTPKSSLLHGDLWAGNMLIDGGRAAAFIDPAISYGHHEMDLAFIDLMGGLDDAFWHAYEEHSPIEPGFVEERKAIYQLWPLLVHVRLFGGGYVGQVENTLTHFGL
jgi:fructosamine-3-kinase